MLSKSVMSFPRIFFIFVFLIPKQRSQYDYWELDTGPHFCTRCFQPWWQPFITNAGAPWLTVRSKLVSKGIRLSFWLHRMLHWVLLHMCTLCNPLLIATNNKHSSVTISCIQLFIRKSPKKKEQIQRTKNGLRATGSSRNCQAGAGLPSSGDAFNHMCCAAFEISKAAEQSTGTALGEKGRQQGGGHPGRAAMEEQRLTSDTPSALCIPSAGHSELITCA